MNIKKLCAVALVTIFCISFNMVGKLVSNALEIPVMLDTIGTMICAYMYGPVSGAIVGCATNLAFNSDNPVLSVYAFTNIAVGVMVGLMAKKRMLENLFSRLTMVFTITAACVAISTPLNIIFFDGYTNNKWADGVIGLLLNKNINEYFCYIAGEFYLDFLDKLLSVFFLADIVLIYRKYGTQSLKDGFRQLFVISLSLVLCFNILPQQKASAGKIVLDHDTFLQTVYDASNGLPGGEANDITQTKDGVLLIGTYSGMYRYSGNEFVWMNDFESVRNVNCFFTDAEDRLWIGTNDSGLSICINDELSNVLNSENGLPSNSVRSIAQGEDGVYYVGTSESLAMVSIANGLRVTSILPEITYATSISTYGSYAAIATDDNSFFLMNGDKIVAYTLKAGISCCYFSNDGTLYAGTAEGDVNKYRISSDKLYLDEVMDCGDLGCVNSLSFTPNGELIVCAENGAGFFNAQNNYHPISLGTFSSCIDHVFFDYQGNIWFTSSRLGLMKMCRSPFSEIYNKLMIDSTVVNCVTEWQDVLYFGTDSGLDAVDKAITNKVDNTLTDALQGMRIRSLMIDSKGNLWISTSGGGALCVDKNMVTTTYDARMGLLGNKVRSTIETASGDILIAEDVGISCVRNGKVVYTLDVEDGLEVPKILCLLEMSDNTILAGTDGGGIAVIRGDKVLQSITPKNGLTSGVILRIVADKSGNGYFIVTSNSLCYMDTDFKVRVLNNFPYFNNYDIVERDDGLLFVLGSAGIYVMDKDTLLNGGTDHTLLDYSKGLRMSLTANAWNYIDDDNNLFIPGGLGVVKINLNNYSETSRSYRMTLASVMVDNQSHFPDENGVFVIPRGANRISLLPDIANYSPNNPNISMFLEGFDEIPKIMPLGAVSELEYTNLPTGKYKFRIAVLNEKGDITAENVYTIIKEKEIYDEWWFLIYVWAILITVIVYLAWLFFRTQFQRGLNVQKRELEIARRKVVMGNETIMTIARTLDAKDMNTSEHSFRVAEYSVLIAKRLGCFDDDGIEELRQTALLHDIGKIGVPDSILGKKGKLSEEEYAIVKTHVIKGAEILENFTSIKNIVDGAKYHHEHYDGKGYPEGLKGDEIPLNARIIGIADAFDAMTENRVYRKQLDIFFVLLELKHCRGTQFDPQLTDILLGLIAEGAIDIEELYKESKQAAERREAK